jgi:hypothetical protein
LLGIWGATRATACGSQRLGRSMYTRLVTASTRTSIGRGIVLPTGVTTRRSSTLLYTMRGEDTVRILRPE